MKYPHESPPLRRQPSYVVAMFVLFISMLLSCDAIGQQLVMPYDQGLSAFRASLRGPVPFAISLVGIVACGAMLIFGGEISGFLRTMIFIILVVAVIVQADNIVSGLGGTDPDEGGSRSTIGAAGLERVQMARKAG